MFNPAEMSKNMKEYGSFIPGIRPGTQTAEFLERVMIAHHARRRDVPRRRSRSCPAWLAPQASADAAASRDFLGGTSILIVVSVALDLVDKLNSQLLMRNYEGFLRGGGGAAAGAAAEAG